MFQSYGKEWQHGRKALRHELHADAVKWFRSRKERQIRKLLPLLLKRPRSFMAHTRQCTICLFMCSVTDSLVQDIRRLDHVSCIRH